MHPLNPMVRLAERLGLCAVAAVVTLTVISSPGFAEPKGGTEDNNVVISDSETTSTSTDDDSGGDAVVTIPKPYLEYKYIPSCSQNQLEGGADALCGQAVNTCPDDRDIRYRVFTLQHLANGDVAPGAEFEENGTACRGPDDEDEGGPVQITTADIRDEATKAAPIPDVNVEPETRSYVNLPTNVFADDETVDVTVQVLGQAIALNFEPTGWAWDFGDGGTGSGQGLENARVGQAGAVEHEYRRAGDTSITLTRTYAVTFTVPGGAPTALPGPGITGTSEPYPLEIREIQATVTELG